MIASAPAAGPDDAIDAARAAAWLGRLRAVIFSAWTLKLSAVSLGTVAWLPVEFLEPPLLLRTVSPGVWEWMWRPWLLDGMQVLICVSSLLAAVGVQPFRPIAIFSISLITIEQGLVRSWGVSNHPEMFAVLATWIVACSPAADGFQLDPRKRTLRPARVYAATIAFVTMVGCWTYTAAAAFRVAHHGLEMFTSVSMKYFIVYNSFTHGSGAAGVFILEHPALARSLQLCLPAATVLEVAAPLVLLSRRFRGFWLVFLMVFQLAIGALMTVYFLESALILSIALIAFDRVSAARNMSDQRSDRTTLPATPASS